jgi:Ca-activated chloride channel family protein
MLAEDARPSRLGRARREARRLVEDLDGDRLGLIAFAGSSFILAPLTIDGSAITLYLDALDPEVASEGGTDLAPVLRQGRELLGAGPADADRVLVVFTDGEGHDSLPVALAEAQQLGAEGVHLILVAEGGRTPARIPVRDDRGTLQAWQQDDAGAVIQTARRDDVLSSLADAAQGTIVAAELPDQAGAVRDLVAAFKRSRSSEARAQRGRPRAWIPLLAGAVLLLGATMTRRTASLMALALLVGAGAVPAQQRGEGMGSGRRAPRASGVSGGTGATARGRHGMVQCRDRGARRQGFRDRAGEPGPGGGVTRSGSAVPRAVQSRPAGATARPG